jgi:CubicO group peptidase (beta-lactamase class C family)
VPTVVIDGGAPSPIDEVLADTDSLSLVVIRDGVLRYEWHAPEHDPSTPSMLFSVSKSIVSLLVGAAIDDGLIDSVDDPVTDYVPELARGGFDRVTIEDLLQMRSDSTYVEDDNPFGVHVEFNYSADLDHDILALEVRDEPDTEFTYRSGDNAILGLILDRVLAPRSISQYLHGRFLDPLGAEHPGRWSTDVTGGLERTWCCLALTATDLARFGQLVLDGGMWTEPGSSTRRG